MKLMKRLFPVTSIKNHVFLLGGIAIGFLISGQLISCNAENTENVQDSSGVEARFFPLEEYLKSEIASVDSAREIIMKLVSNGKTVDSAVISKDQFHRLAAPFTTFDISDSALRKNYKQDIFLDLSTSSYSFTYTARDDEQPDQYIHVLVDTLTESAKQLFINQRMRQNDEIIARKMGWKTGTSFYINTIFQFPQRQDSITLLSVKWMK